MKGKLLLRRGGGGTKPKGKPPPDKVCITRRASSMFAKTIFFNKVVKFFPVQEIQYARKQKSCIRGPVSNDLECSGNGLSYQVSEIVLF